MQLRSYLEVNDISISAFAQAIGVGEQAVYKYLNGKRQPSRLRLERIAAVTKGAVMPNDFHRFAARVPCPCESHA